MDTMANLDTDLLRPTEVVRLLRVSRSWVYEAAKVGRIPSVRLGGPDGPLRFLPDDVEHWLERARSDWLPGDTAKSASRRAAQPAAFRTAQLTIDALAGNP
jgi:excisionase family DNA binding protein